MPLMGDERDRRRRYDDESSMLQGRSKRENMGKNKTWKMEGSVYAEKWMSRGETEVGAFMRVRVNDRR